MDFSDGRVRRGELFIRPLTVIDCNAVICVVAGGPYFPKLGQKATAQKTNIRCPRPQFQMFLHRTQLEASKVF